MIKTNITLIIIIVISAFLVCLWHYQERIYFNTLQKLHKQHNELVSINKSYIANYEEYYSLLKIEEYAKKNLKMKLPKIKRRL